MEYLKHEELIKKLGERIRSLRESKGISQEELSFRTELSRNQIGRIERGEINTGVSTLFEMEKGLAIDVREFL